MNQDCVIVDANIAFKALASNRGDLRQRLSPSTNLKLYCPRFLFVELFKHRGRLATAANLSEDELVQALQILVSRLEFVTEANIPVGMWMEAYRLCKDVDEKDTPYVALALYLEGYFWTMTSPSKPVWKERASLPFLSHRRPCSFMAGYYYGLK